MTRETPMHDEPARPSELRWTITKVIREGGEPFYMIDGPCIRGMEVVPASESRNA